MNDTRALREPQTPSWLAAHGPHDLTPAMANTPEPSFSAVLWRTLKKIDHSKINKPSHAFRNALAVAIPLALGIEWNYPLGGVAVATGALNVAFSDARDPYPQRARRMLAWSLLGAIAVFLGSVTGNYPALAVLVAGCWAFVAGLLISISVRAGDLGLNTLVAVIVYGARGALSPKGASIAGLLALGGGLLQTALALLFWPIQRYAPERRAVAKLYLDLAKEVDPSTRGDLSPALKQFSPDVQDTLSSLGRDHSVEGERLRLLLDQVDRLRLSSFHVERLRNEAGTNGGGVPGRQTSELLGQLLECSAALLSAVGACLSPEASKAVPPEALEDVERVLEKLQAQKSSGSALAGESAAAADVLVGQLRLVMRLAESSTPEGAMGSSSVENASPLRLQFRSWLSILRANLTLESSVCKHAIRMAICVILADMIARNINLQRNYWLPMTVAVVLKPDFTTTISRGVLRLGGTLAGLVLATLLFHLLPLSGWTQLTLVGTFTFFLRYLGPANYGIFTMAISGLIVFLVAVTGVAPGQVVLQRALNTAAGGVFALVAYALWPTWERTHVSEEIGKMIDATRDYFHAVMARFTNDDEQTERELDRTRDDWRRARSNAEASVDRVASEPNADPARMELLNSILASSHSLVHAIMSLEAAALQLEPQPLPRALESFAHDVDFTLYYVAAALRGSKTASSALPQLRQDHRRMLEGRAGSTLLNEYVLTETDSLTVSLNTLREKVTLYIS